MESWYMGSFLKKFLGFFFLLFSAGFVCWYPLIYLIKN
ncbi:hypothetical protein NitYY0918_C0795 [Nitratiruptor sp. YY09-18]|nr:hypothetical protein NitYY0918_C0795 [Nitratiruptor sp. YY09-18]